jgi:hypothetical protein
MYALSALVSAACTILLLVLLLQVLHALGVL